MKYLNFISLLLVVYSGCLQAANPVEERTEVHLKINKVTLPHSGVCRIEAKVLVDIDMINVETSIRFEHINPSMEQEVFSPPSTYTGSSYNPTVSEIARFNIANGPGKERGKVRVVVKNRWDQTTSGTLVGETKTPWMNYTIDCPQAVSAPSGLSQVTPSTINLTVTPVSNSIKPFGNQFCPTKVKVVGTIKAGSSLNGKAIFVGNTLSDAKIKPFSANKGQTKKVSYVRQLTWSAPQSTTFTVSGGGAAHQLMKQDIMQGLNITGQNNQVVLSFPRKKFTLSCSEPGANPNVQGPNGMSMLPNHTGGGAPTDLQGQQPAVQPVSPKSSSMPDKKKKVPASRKR